MLDFYDVRQVKKGKVGSEYYELYPDFKIKRCKDLMVRGGAFYAIWDPELNLWSTDEYTVQRIVDSDLYSQAQKLEEETGLPVKVKYLRDFNSGTWIQFKNYISKLSDSYRQLDTSIAFANTETSKGDYVSRKAPYPLEEGPTEAFDALFTTLYDEENLIKLMWAIGSVISGDSKKIQKFFVLFGLPGTGKSTSLNLIERIFEGYTTSFEASTMTNVNSNFALEAFKSNPLVAIDHEGDLSRIRNNSIITSVVAHDNVVMNLKYQHPFTIRLNTMLFIATNKPVMITDRSSGIIRRLVDIRPSGKTVSARDYESLVSQMDFELGAIASKCLSLYLQLGKNHYNRYVPIDMIYRTNMFFNFVDSYYLEFVKDDWITLKNAWNLYKKYCEEAGITNRLTMPAFRDELKNYWNLFESVARVEGQQYRSVYSGFNTEVFKEQASSNKSTPISYDWLALSEQTSIFDRDHAGQPAQLAKGNGLPKYIWEKVKTKLGDIDTTKLHYVLPKENMITIDFDLKDEYGEKSLSLNIEAARNLPPTYAEVSKGGNGLHLHYFYDGDVSQLSRIYEPDIEVLVPSGNFSIRRKLSVCNNHAITTINSGLPLKPQQGTNMALNKKTISNEKALRSLILRNLQKEFHPNTKPSVDFIKKILDDANEQGLRYDVSDMKPFILNFASNSTNQKRECIRTALSMKYVSDHEEVDEEIWTPMVSDEIVFFDVEVLINYFIICWKYKGSSNVVKMINPSPDEVEKFLEMRLVGFNNRRYDNHMLYARYLGFSVEQIFNLSQRIIVNKDQTAYFREAYGVSYADVYDLSTDKKSLKEWEVDLGLPYLEMEIDWNVPLPESDLQSVLEYCCNDVNALESVYNHIPGDITARQILSELSGLPLNSSTRSHTSRIVFGKGRPNKDTFNYPDLSEMFPGYIFDNGESTYRGEVVGEGGYVWAQPGMYNRVAYLDVNSMHPNSIVQLNLFGDATKNFADLLEARMLVKNGVVSGVKKMFDGKLSKYMGDKQQMKAVSDALKLGLNSAYGDTFASFDNPFRDPRNVDNVVAKRGSLFMVDLKNALLERGCKPIHFKTDSVKIADATEDDIQFVKEFGEKYGYTFSVEAMYDRLVLINDAVLVAREEDTKKWHSVGARFSHPYVFKTLFSKEPIVLEDYREKRKVKDGSIYLERDGETEFVGRIGAFLPVKNGGYNLLRIAEDRRSILQKTSGYQWMLYDVVASDRSNYELDTSYYESLVEEDIAEIAKFGDPTIFLGD